ncbi:hypothetical protein BGZ63DRAFT_369389 [Mariannaea sp. PMI_226]|nr:hypothetical protein BGZ63DRAFT_369389 [Mariannaea sp. PMI_226]
MVNSRESLSNVRRLLEAYALAFPHLRLSLKIIGEPNPTWQYSPCSLAEPREAVIQLFGGSLLSNCVEVKTVLKSMNTGGCLSSTWGTLTALLPKADCPISLIKDKGSFISVDSRPIIAWRGIGKKIVDILKSLFSESLGTSQPTRAVSSPFMRLAIVCDKGSYDLNITPLKDEVLFKDEQIILDGFRYLCDQLYTPESSWARNQDRRGSQLSTEETEGYALPPPNVSQNDETRPGPKVILSHPTSSNTPEEEFLLEDQDLLEDFDDISFQKHLGRPDQNSLEIPHLATASTRGSDAATSRSTATMMRTIINVNLSRKDSNASDECSTAGLVPVHVAQHSTASLATIEATSGLCHKDPAPTRQRESIRQYFQPRSDRPIDIALDETATSGNVHSQEEQSHLCERTTHHQAKRQPLKELTSSVLNMLPDDEEEDEQTVVHEAVSGFSSPELDIGQTSDAPLRNHFVYSARHGRDAISNTQGGITSTPMRRLFDPIAPRGRGSRGIRRPDVPRVSSPSEIALPGFDSRDGPRIRDQMALTLWSRQMEGRTERHDLRQTAVSTRDGFRGSAQMLAVAGNATPSLGQIQATRSSQLELNETPFTTESEESQDEFPSQATKISSTSQFQVSSKAIAQHDFGPENPMSAAGMASDYQRDQWQRRSQALTTSTPNMLGERLELADQSGGSNDQDDMHGGRICDTPLMGVRFYKRRCSRPQSETATREAQDPRKYYMKGRNLRTLSGKRKRLPSMMLPLEKVPSFQQTQRLSTTLKSGQTGETNSPLLFTDMRDAVSVEVQLKKAVKSWLDGKDETLVEYSLLSAAKGKVTG